MNYLDEINEFLESDAAAGATSTPAAPIASLTAPLRELPRGTQRRHADEVAINRQLAIAKSHAQIASTVPSDELGRLRKVHAIDVAASSGSQNARRDPSASASHRLTKQELVHNDRLQAGLAEVLTPADPA